jgi:GMP synthase-like glutamine amidotransferase
LLSKALGGRVTRNPVKEIGWGVVGALPNTPAPRWGPADRFLSYHWHGETFSIPDGAIRIWSSAHCENQAFVMGERHIGMQCHIEMTEALIQTWCETGGHEIESELGRSPAVQTPEAMREGVVEKVRALHGVADLVYDTWLEGVRTEGM